MVSSVEKKLAYMCHDCDELHFLKVEPVQITGKTAQFFPCSLAGKGLGIMRVQHDYVITMLCPFCGEDVFYRVSMKDFWNDEPFTATCHECGDFLFTLLNDQASLCDALHEFNAAFAKTLVPRASDYVRELASSGKMTCECGCSKIQIRPFDKGLRAVCSDCGLSKKILIRNEDDAKRVTEYDTITIKDVRKQKVFEIKELMHEYQ